MLVEDERDYSSQDDSFQKGKEAYDATKKIVDKISQEAGKTAAGETAGAATGEAAGSTAAGTAGTATGEAAGGTVAGTAGTATGEAAGTAAGTAGGEAATGAAAGSVAPGVGTLIGLAVGLLTAGANHAKHEIQSIGEKSELEDTYNIDKIHPFRWLLWGGVACLFFFITMFSTIKDKGTAGSVSNYSLTSYGYEVPESYNGNINKEFAEETLAEYSDESPYKDGVLKYIGKYASDDSGYGFQDAMYKSITKMIYEFIRDMKRYNRAQLLKRIITLDFGGLDYDANRSMKYFFDNKWPYALQKGDNYPLVGNIMPEEAAIYDLEYEKYDGDLFDDVNFAEIMGILSCNERFNWKNVKFEDYNEFIHTKDAQMLYYELRIKWAIVFSKEFEDPETGQMIVEEMESELYDTPEEAIEASKNPPDGYESTAYFCKADIKPFGLRELYTLAEVDPDEQHLDFEMHTNYEMLPYSERLCRTYLREEKDIIPIYFDEERPETSTIFEDLLNAYGEAKGRSAYSYFSEEDTYNLKELEEKEIMYTDDVELQMDLEALRTSLGNLPEGANILDVYSFYINQGWFAGVKRGNGTTDIGKYGCIDTSYMMIYQYYAQKKLSNAEIASISKNYVSGDQFEGSTFCADNGITVSGNKSFSFDTIKNEIDQGNPLVLHIRGTWNYEGKTLHRSTKQHFLVISGYTDEGVVVCDPGSKSNTSAPIPYEAFSKVSDLYLRTFDSV